MIVLSYEQCFIWQYVQEKRTEDIIVCSICRRVVSAGMPVGSICRRGVAMVMTVGSIGRGGVTGLMTVVDICRGGVAVGMTVSCIAGEEWLGHDRRQYMQ